MTMPIDPSSATTAQDCPASAIRRAASRIVSSGSTTIAGPRSSEPAGRWPGSIATDGGVPAAGSRVGA